MIIDKDIPKLFCPRCRVPLERGQKKLHCIECKKNYEIRDNVPSFIEKPFYWGEIPQNEMQNVNRRIKDEYWKKVLEECDFEEVQRKKYFIENITRGNFHFLCQLSSSSIVLDVGSGMGTISESLSHYYSRVVAIEPVKERIIFSSIRFQQENIKNITLIQTDLSNLPFQDETFHLIIMNGVLEWVAQYEENNSPESIQIKTLKKLHKLLKPGGILYIGIENRIGFPYFFGSLDHSYLPYTSLLPRYIADKITKIKKGYPYRTYTYSLKGYKYLLSRAGFKESVFFYPHPGYNNPRHIIPLSREMLNAYFSLICKTSRKLRRKTKRALALSGIFNWLSPCFLIYAQKKGKRKRSKFEEVIEKAIKKTGNSKYSDSFSFILNNTSRNHITLIVFIALYKDPFLVVKIPIKEEFNNMIENEYRNIKYIRNLLPADIRQSLPKPVILDFANNKAVSIMRFVQGKQVEASLNTKKLAFIIDEIANWLLEFHKSLIKEKKILRKEEIDNLIFLPLKELSEKQQFNVPEGFYQWLEEKTLKFKKLLIPITPQHGDFWHGNIVKNDNNLGIYDWEFFGLIDLPLFDFFHFLTMLLTSPLYFGKSRKDNFNVLFSLNKTTRMIQKRVISFANEIEINEEFISILYFFYLMNFYDKIGKRFLAQEINDEMIHLIKEFVLKRESFILNGE